MINLDGNVTTRTRRIIDVDSRSTPDWKTRVFGLGPSVTLPRWSLYHPHQYLDECAESSDDASIQVDTFNNEARERPIFGGRSRGRSRRSLTIFVQFPYGTGDVGELSVFTATSGGTSENLAKNNTSFANVRRPETKNRTGSAIPCRSRFVLARTEGVRRDETILVFSLTVVISRRIRSPDF